MEFLWPFMLWLLLLIPVFVLAYVWAQRRRQRYALRYASLSMVKQALGRGPGLRRHIPPLLFLLGLTAMIVGLARPEALVQVPAAEGTVILTLDTSGSMAADDLLPSRMEAAKTAARAFVHRQPKSIRIGIVSFSDDAFLVQAPTTDQDAVLAAIDRLYPQRGTAIGRGLIASVNTLFENTPSSGDPADPNSRPSSESLDSLPTLPKGTFASAVVILLTDGENNQGPDPVDISQQVADRGIRVYTVGVGSPEGSILHIAGRSIRTRLDEDMLKQIAQTTNGDYYNATREGELEAIYEKLGTQLVLRTERTEVTAALTGLAAVLSIVGGILSLLWFNRLP